MKTSFYFVLWIVLMTIIEVYLAPRLSDAGANISPFMLTLLAVIGISILLKNIMPKTIVYENASRQYPILEDVYTMNVTSFSKRLLRDTIIQCAYAAYFIITTIVIILTFIYTNDISLITLAFFGLFAFSTTYISLKFIKAYCTLKRNPTSQTCLDIAEYTYNLDYTSYYEEHQDRTFEEVFPPKPRFYSIFRIVSTLFAAGAIIIGIIFMAQCVQDAFFFGIFTPVLIVVSMKFLYGSFALYFGIKDLISSIYSIKSSRAK